MKYFIQTYGCQMNYSDSERIASVLESLSYDLAASSAEADLLILNTCSVKQKAEDRVLGLRKEMARMKKLRPQLCIGITGCIVRKTSTQKQEDVEGSGDLKKIEGAKKTGDSEKSASSEKPGNVETSGVSRNKLSEKRDKILNRMPELSFSFKIDETARLPELLEIFHPEMVSDDSYLDEGSLANYFKIAAKKTSKAQVLVPVMTGCDKFCTYCIVPFARGREKSRDFEEIIEECRKHVEEGAIEITLVGQTVNSYGLSFNDRKFGKFTNFISAGKSPFAALLRDLDKLHDRGLRRLRFMSPHPRDFGDELIETIAKLKTGCPYIHMPVQSGSDENLRRMNRNYSAAEYKEIMKKIRKEIPDCAISTDIIVGFCGETEEEFKQTYDMYKELEWDMCFLSQYSPRKGTYSERKLKDDVTPTVKSQRWHRMNDELLIPMAAKAHAAFLGKTVEVLVEKCKLQEGEIKGELKNDEPQKNASFKCSGRTPHSKEVFFSTKLTDANLTNIEAAQEALLGKLVQVKITEAKEFYLFGELI